MAARDIEHEAMKFNDNLLKGGIWTVKMNDHDVMLSATKAEWSAVLGVEESDGPVMMRVVDQERHEAMIERIERLEDGNGT